MAEKLMILQGDKLNYEGLFDMKELMAVVRQWASDTGYWVIDANQNESIRPEGKYITLDWIIFKKFTDYAKSLFKLNIQFQGIKDVVVERDGKKVKLQEGKAIISFDIILETDYENRWEVKPVFYVVRMVFEKYVYSPFISAFERQIRADYSALKNNMKGFLNLSQFL